MFEREREREREDLDTRESGHEHHLLLCPRHQTPVLVRVLIRFLTGVLVRVLGFGFRDLVSSCNASPPVSSSSRSCV